MTEIFALYMIGGSKSYWGAKRGEVIKSNWASSTVARQESIKCSDCFQSSDCSIKVF